MSVEAISTEPARASPAEPAEAPSTSSSRLALQQRAPRTIQRHVMRAAARVLVLVASDLAVFVAARAAVRALRDGAVFGAGVGQSVSAAFPFGFLGGWQFAAALVIGLAAAGAYGPGDDRRDLRRIFLGVALAGGLALWGSIWTRGIPAVALHYVALVAVVGSALTLSRRLVDFATNRLASRVLRSERVVCVGNPGEAATAQVANYLRRAERMDVLGWIAPAEHEKAVSVAGEQWLGRALDVWAVLQRVRAETVVICGPIDDRLFDLIVEAAAAAGCRLVAVSRYGGVGRLRSAQVFYHRNPFVELTVPAMRGRHLLVKRVIDIVVAAAGLVLLAPILIILGLLIKLDSRGPIIFRQQRVGLGGGTFGMIKFRTMRDGADSEKDSVAHLNQSGDRRLFKIPDDPRVTRFGAWLRRWSLDELPQLWNVVRGDMSLVGPRPFFETDLSAYSDHHFVRLGAKPGITGLWQINGRSSVVDFEQVVRLDREYIEHWSLAADLKILLMTIPAVMRREGAY